MSYNDIFSINIQGDTITIKTDPTVAKDLIYALSTLLDLSHSIRARTEHARAFQAATDEKDVARRKNEFKCRAREIFTKFQDHLNNGCAGNKAQALQCIKKDFQLGYGEAQIYVIEGRRLYKAGLAIP